MKISDGQIAKLWAYKDYIEFARAIEREAYRAGQENMRERAAEAGSEVDFGFDVAKTIRALEIEEPK